MPPWSSRLLALAAVLMMGCTAPFPSVRSTGGARLFVPWLSLNGALVAPATDPSGTPSPAGGVRPFQHFVHPVAAAAAANDVYIADAGLGTVFRFDITLNLMTPLKGVVARDGTRLAIGPDLSLYVLDPATRQVLRFARSGRLLGTFRDDAQLARPTDLLIDASGRVFVADAVLNHVVAFSPLGRASIPLTPRGETRNQVMSIGAIASGSDALYFADRVCRCIARLSPDGVVLETFGHQSVDQPARMAVDRYNRVYVADAFDGSLKVFADGRLVADMKASELALQRGTDIHINESAVVLVDGPGAKVVLMHLAPPPTALRTSPDGAP